jgi:TonB-dependent starch-binding outer membrane protein SusC
MRSSVRVYAGAMLAWLVAIAPLAAQDARLVGQVTDATSGAPLSEVQVYLNGTGLGTLTRSNGRFVILNVQPGSYDARAERIGFQSASQRVTVAAGQAVEVNFQLSTQALGLDEIVVTGTAGAARRREIGNSITQISTAELPVRPTQTFELLQGAAPGVELTTVSGNVGQGQRIKLRGITSVAQSNQPLIYVDGVRIMNGAFPVSQGGDQYNSTNAGNRGSAVTVSAIDQINPNDIERIEVIKGSAATTLYGTQASSGVIQIFTKRGSTGSPVWSVESQQGTGWSRKFGGDFGVNYLWMEHYMRDSWFGRGYDPGPAGDKCTTLSPGGASDTRCSWPGSVWYQSYSASVRGGNNNLQYFASGGYDNDTGILPHDSDEKWTIRGNFTFSPLTELQMQWNSAYSNLDLTGTPSANNAQGLELNAFRQKANYFGDANPVIIASVLDWDLLQANERFTTGGTVTWSPIESVTSRFTIGYDYSIQDSRNLRPFGFNGFPQGGLTTGKFTNRVLTFDYVGTFRFSLTDAIRSNFSWGGQAIGDDTHNLTGWGENFPGTAEPTISSASLVKSWEERERVWNAGFFFQDVFDIHNRYFITTGLRVDGNSAFGEGFGLQLYPKLSASWVVSDESWWKDGFGSLKLRSAYGQSGKAPGSFAKVRTWSPLGYKGSPAFTPANVGNPDLGPEVTTELELGFDAAWLHDRLTAGVTYYHQNTTDALFQVPNMPSSGYAGTQLKNVGELENQGTEIQLNGSPIQRADWALDLGLSLSFLHSEVLDMGGIPEFTTGRGLGDARVMKGQPVPVRLDWYISNPDEVANPVYEANHIYGPVFPTRQVSGNATVRLPAGISLSARGEFRGGHYLSVSPMSISRSVISPQCFDWYVDRTKSTTLKPETPAIWRARCTPTAGRGYMYKADYFKLRSLAATIPMAFAFPESVQNATLSLSLNNSYLWTKDIPWMDPEGGNNDGAAAVAPGLTERTPAPITFRVGLQVTF